MLLLLLIFMYFIDQILHLLLLQLNPMINGAQFFTGQRNRVFHNASVVTFTCA